MFLFEYEWFFFFVYCCCGPVYDENEENVKEHVIF